MWKSRGKGGNAVKLEIPIEVPFASILNILYPEPDSQIEQVVRDWAQAHEVAGGFCRREDARRHNDVVQRDRRLCTAGAWAQQPQLRSQSW